MITFTYNRVYLKTCESKHEPFKEIPRSNENIQNEQEFIQVGVSVAMWTSKSYEQCSDIWEWINKC